MKNKKLLIFLAIILILSSIVRIYRLGQVPNGLTVDEADMAYNAYSIKQTGKDIYNRNNPLFFQSLDDYKPPFAIYLTIPSIYLFGLNDFSVRFTPALIGSLTPLLAFFIFKLIYPQKGKSLKYSSLPAITAALIFTFAPWNVAISRATFMYIELIFFYLLFLIFFLLSFKSKKWLILAALVLGLTLYVYYAAIIYLPLIVLTTATVFHKDFNKIKKTAIISIIVLLIVSLPALVHYTNPQSKSRLNAISIFTPDITLPLSLKEAHMDKEQNVPFSNLSHNRRIVYTNAVLDNYFDYFNFDYLFVNAKNIRYFYTNGTGLFYSLEALFFLAGSYILLKRRAKLDLLLLSFLIIGPIPAAITLGSPFPHRAILLILTIQIISIIGFVESLKKFSKNYTSHFLIMSVYVVSVFLYCHQYFFHSKYEFTSENDNGAWFSTVRDAIPQVNEQKLNSQNIVFSWSQAKLVPAVYFLLYTQQDPKIIQEKAALWTNEPPSFKQLYNKIGNIEFRPINWDQDKNLKNTLFVGYPEEFKEVDKSIVGKTLLPTGETHFILVKNE